MTQQGPVTTSFNGGELSPLMAGCVDTAIYAIGAELLENFVPTIEGPIQKCPGFRRIRAAMATSTWLMRFVFNDTQSYVLEGFDRGVGFYTNGGRIEAGPTAPYTVAVPYAAAEWPAVSMQQSFDRLYMAHPLHPPAALSRTGGATFVYAALALTNGPFGDGNADRTITVTLGGVLTPGGAVTITASAAIFLAGHAGALFQVEAHDFSTVPAWQVGIDGIVVGSQRRSDGKVYQAATAGRAGTVAPTHDEGTEWDGSPGNDVNTKGPYGVQWTYLYDRFGIVRITAVTSATTATATVVRRVPDSLATVASWRWTHAAFSDAAGWPNLVMRWNQRLCFWRGFELYASVVGDFYNFQAFTSGGLLTSDLAFREVLDAPDPPIWVIIDREMIVGTASSEYAIGALNQAAGVSGVNIASRRQSNYGSAPVFPAEPGTSVIFVQRGARTLREAAYDFRTDRYQAANINRWARHICASGLIQIGYQQQSEELLFGVRADGQLVFRGYDPEQEVKGFSRRVLAQGGLILSAVCIPGQDGAHDEIWALCQWTNPDGSIARSVQQMATWWPVQSPDGAPAPIADACFVDDALSDVLAVPSAIISGLGHLVGVTVSILADGGVCVQQVVPGSGIITIEYPAYKRTVGRGYTARMRTLRAEVRDATGQSAQGKRKRLTNLILRLIETSGIKVNTLAAAGRDQSLLDRPTLAAMDTPAPLFSGDTLGVSVVGEWGRAGQYEIISDDPRPCFVVATMPRFEVSAQ